MPLGVGTFSRHPVQGIKNPGAVQVFGSLCQRYWQLQNIGLCTNWQLFALCVHMALHWHLQNRTGGPVVVCWVGVHGASLVRVESWVEWLMDQLNAAVTQEDGEVTSSHLGGLVMPGAPGPKLEFFDQ